MKQISFGMQALACFAVVVAGNFAADALDNPILINVAAALAGIAFIIHPVLPSWATWGNQKTMLNAVRAGGVLALAFALLTRFSI